MGRNVAIGDGAGAQWCWKGGANGEVECDVRTIGYWERNYAKEMPLKGTLREVPLRATSRPNFAGGSTDAELHLPSDTVELWTAFNQLPEDERQQFLQVGSIFQLACSLGHEYQTTRFALMVIVELDVFLNRASSGWPQPILHHGSFATSACSACPVTKKVGCHG
jgi:hypothetical protein